MSQGDILHLDDEILSALLDGELSAAEQQAAFDHQLICDGCRSRAEALGHVADLVGRASRWPAASSIEGLGAVGWPEVVDGVAAAESMVAALAALGDPPALADLPSVTPGPWPGPGPGTGRRRRGLRVGVSAAAAVVAVGIFVAAFEHPHRPRGPAETASSTPSPALPTSLGSFPDATSLRSTLQVDLASRASGGSAATLPCHEEAALDVGQRAKAKAAFSAPLTYAGVPAQVFAYRVGDGGPASNSSGSATGRSGTGAGGIGAGQGHVAEVVRDGDCTALTRLGW